MKRNRLSHALITLLLLLPMAGRQSGLHAQAGIGYSADAPLIVVCNWDRPPYEFNNNDGEPDGYNIELMRRILNRLHVNYKLVMTSPEQVSSLLEQRKAGLITGTSYQYYGRPYILSRAILGYHKLRIATRKGTRPLHSLADLSAHDTLVLSKHDEISHERLQNRGFSTPYQDLTPVEALAAIDRGTRDYFLWDEARLKWTIKKLDLPGIVLKDIGIPNNEIHFVGYDKALIKAIDNEYARLEQSGEQGRLYDRWFGDDQDHDDTSPLLLMILISMVFAGCIAFLLVRLIRARLKAAYQKSVNINQMMTQALHAGRYYVTEYNLQTSMIYNLHGGLLPSGRMGAREFVARIHPSVKDEFLYQTSRMKTGEISQWGTTIRWNAATDEVPVWIHLRGNAITETEGGKTRRIVYTVKDISQEIAEENTNREIGHKYLVMFNANLVPMAFYDKNGMNIDTNESMRRIYGQSREGEDFFRRTCLFDRAPFKNDFNRYSRTPFHACHRMHYPKFGIDKYVESRVRPVFDDNGNLQFYIQKVRDVSIERQLHIQQQKHNAKMRRTHDSIRHYEERLFHLLENSQMCIWNSDWKTRQIHFSYLPQRAQHTETFEEYVSRLCDEEQAKSLQFLTTHASQQRPFNIVHRFKRDLRTDRPSWCTISGIPRKDEQGNPIGYFGIIRDITALMETQQQLRKERNRAENSGKMKSAFLANMTHEIRTPLNAIIGFSDLLPAAGDAGERMEFIRIIRDNCDMLMRLINDILEASSMGVALAIEPMETDFSKAFDDICQTLAKHVQEKPVRFIKENPYESYLTTLDIGRVQQVLTNFTTNAVKYTHEGHIKVGYRAERRTTYDAKGERNGLYFYCEDTGAGIPPEQQGSVFERFVKLNDFVQGTGLGLSICQAIARRCNGHIGVSSEGQGHGSTFWMWIPCDRIEKK